MRKLFCFILLLGACTFAQAQELQCVVDIQTPTQGSDKQVYAQMKDAITKYVNFRKWSDMTYLPEERIKCRMQFIISDRPAIDEFRGSLQVQIIRPTFNSTYETVVLNMMDQNIYFRFTAFQPFEFSENNYIDELTSILNFYCYMIVGFDQETFQMSGGTRYFEKAQNIVNLAQGNGGSGWRNNDGQQTRYWLVTDMLDNSMNRIHNVYYVYHRQGLDQMEKNPAMGRKVILQSLRELKNLNQRYPGKFITRMFLTAKSQEIMDIFRKADQRDKTELIKVMDPLDPANSSGYEALSKER